MNFNVQDAEGRIFVDDPRIEAYRYIAYLVNVQHRHYSLIIDNGEWRVRSDGLADAIFASQES